MPPKPRVWCAQSICDTAGECGIRERTVKVRWEGELRGIGAARSGGRLFEQRWKEPSRLVEYRNTIDAIFAGVCCCLR